MQKRTVLAFALVLGISAPAAAADLTVKARPAPVAVGYSWTGCYVGGQVGGLWGDTRWTSSQPNSADFIPNQDVDFSNVAGGVHAGCYYQLPSNFVLGFEADINYAGVNKFSVLDVVNLDEIARTRMQWFGTARGVLGYSWDRWMAYGTGGLAFTNLKYSYENYTDATRTVLEGRADGSQKFGWTAGGGLAYALTNNWIVKGEYLYVQFERRNVIPPEVFNAKTQFHVARVGVSYKFGGGPVVANY